MGPSDLCRFSVHAIGIRIIFTRQKTAQKIIAVCIRLRYELLSGAPKSTFSALIIPSRTPGGPSEAPLKTLGAPWALWARGAPWVLWAPGALRGLSNLLPRDIADRSPAAFLFNPPPSARQLSRRTLEKPNHTRLPPRTCCREISRRPLAGRLFFLTHHPLRGSSLGELWKNLTKRAFPLELAAGGPWVFT